MADLVGKTVGKYRIVAKLGRGGMAEVYKAYQPGLDRYVGIKVLHAHLVDDKDFIGRFEREALAVGKLRHPNIVQAVDFDRDEDMYFMAMEFIDGPTLKDEIKARRTEGKPFSLKEIARIFSALCSAMDYAHARGMVHRDLKPANVMINQEGQVVLTDFGIARIMGATQYTQTGALSGTPAYMSPEQGQGERGDERSDIYSLGVMLYELVTGVVPYDGDTPFAVIMKHISEPLPLPTKLNPDVPESVERVILKAMSKDPGDRYQTAGEMARALREAVGLLPGEENLPLAIVAPRPKIDQIEHSTGRLSTTAAPSKKEGGTIVSTHDTTRPGVAPAKSLPMIPVIIGGIVAVLVLIGLIGFLFLGRGVRSDRATETAVAIANVTGTAAAFTSATETAEAESAAAATAQANAQAAAPTQTAQAAETAAAAETAEAARIATAVSSGLMAASAATADAATAAADAAAAATAEALAKATPTSGPADTPLPADTPPPANTPIPVDTPTPGPPTFTATPAPPIDTPTPERPAISGKLAFPVDNGSGKYDVFIYSIPEGQLIGRINGARQPNFRADGQKLLINGEGGSFGENVFEASPSGSIDRPVSGSPTDSYPVYSPDGGRAAYSNPQLALGTDGGYHSYIFVQCGLIPPPQEGDQTCQDVARFGILVPNGQIGEIQGSNPVWTASDQIVYKGCNTWQGGGSCGIFITISWGNKRGGNGNTPTKLAGIDGGSTIPTDTKGGLVAYHSTESGDWEAYVANLSGGKINISNNPTSSDGLPTLSPDGQWVAFASDREGGWAVYTAPAGGGPAQKLFDFPKANPWGVGDHDWTNERMSWGR